MKVYDCPVRVRPEAGNTLGFDCPCGHAKLGLAWGPIRTCPSCGKHLRAYYPTTPNDAAARAALGAK